MATIAIGFDGTIVIDKYPEIGELIPGAIETIKCLQNHGHDVIIWTKRDKLELQEMIIFLEDNGVKIDINKFPHYTSSPKNQADLYIDDKILGAPKKINGDKEYLDWSAVGYWLSVYKYINVEHYAELREVSIS